jgi:5-keto 4-deoxyuronate isomerase
MVFLYYQPLYFLAEEDGNPFHWVGGDLHPMRGIFGESTPAAPVWSIHIGI